MEEPKFCIIQFKYSYKAKEDEEVRVVGNTNELGNWDINRAEKMVFSTIDTSSIWKTKENIKVRQNSTLEYKYVIFKDKKFLRWENLPNCQNRKVNITSMIRVVIWDKQDNPESQIKSDQMPKTDSPKKLQTGTPMANINNDFDNNSQGEVPDHFDYYHYDNTPNHISDYQVNEADLKDVYPQFNYHSDDEADDQIKTEMPSEKNVDLDDKDEIIMCSFYLPLNCIMNKDKTFKLELTNYPLYHTLFRMKNPKMKWIGLLKNSHLLSNEEYTKMANELKEKHNMYAVKIDTEIFDKISVLFKEILEPLFHYISLSPAITEEFSHFDVYWDAFKKFNEKMAIDIKQHLTPNTLIYLHDYHFLLVPSYLYSKCCQEQEVFQNLSIGLFMHSPFPSHEIFKRIPFREEILKSMMNCSVIGFHTFDYSRNFLKSSKRLLSINYESTINGDLAVNYYGRTLIIRVKNATPEIDLIKEDLNSDDFKSVYNEIKEKYKGKFIYISLDHLKFLSGIKNKLEGYRRFLRDIGSNSKRNVYLEYIRYSSDDLEPDGSFLLDDTQKEMLKQIEALVALIKEEFGDETVEVIKKKVSYVERLALFAASNCFIRSSKQESFSLGIYEFLILKQFLDTKTGISYMVSELSGVNTSLAGTIKINPFDYKSINNGFLTAYQTMDEKGMNNITINKDFLHAMKSSTNEWVRSFLRDIKNTKLNDKNTYYLGADEGLNFKLMKLNADFKKLPLNDIIAQYEKSTRRLLFFDYEGTLPAATQNDGDFHSKGQKPSDAILSLLEELASDKHNTVFIITGRETKLVAEWFGNVKGLGLAAEHGFMYRYNSGQNKDKWIRMIREYNNEWIKCCVGILEPYKERCEGSFLEVKEASVVWQYRDCDQELGKSFATIITSEFESTSKKMNLKVINGKGYVEIIAKGINKGSFVASIIKENLAKDHLPDFIFCIGDDTTDEKMFQYLRMKENEIKVHSKNARINTVTVGKKPSKAMYYVINPNNVQDMIQKFVNASNKIASSYSTFNIRGLMINKEDVSHTQNSEHKKDCNDDDDA